MTIQNCISTDTRRRHQPSALRVCRQPTQGSLHCIDYGWLCDLSTSLVHLPCSTRQNTTRASSIFPIVSLSTANQSTVSLSRRPRDSRVSSRWFIQDPIAESTRVVSLDTQEITRVVFLKRHTPVSTRWCWCRRGVLVLVQVQVNTQARQGQLSRRPRDSRVRCV